MRGFPINKNKSKREKLSNMRLHVPRSTATKHVEVVSCCGLALLEDLPKSSTWSVRVAMAVFYIFIYGLLIYTLAAHLIYFKPHDVIVSKIFGAPALLTYCMASSQEIIDIIPCVLRYSVMGHLAFITEQKYPLKSF